MSTLPMVRPAVDPGEESEHDFDWRSHDSVICRQQDAIAIYSNRFGQAVIRRERSWDEEFDATIVIGPECAIQVAHAILTAAGHGDVQFYRTDGFACEDVAVPVALPRADRRIEEPPKPKDRTASERQRRHRDRKRNGITAVTEGDRNGATRDVTVTPDPSDPPLFQFPEAAE